MPDDALHEQEYLCIEYLCIHPVIFETLTKPCRCLDEFNQIPNTNYVNDNINR